QAYALANNKLSGKAKESCPREFNTVVGMLDKLQEDFQKFQKTCEERSGLCEYLGQWLKMVAITKNVVVSEREGNWDLHVATIDNFQRVFCEMDSYNKRRNEIRVSEICCINRNVRQNISFVLFFTCKSSTCKCA
ncbi:unnamed protein product, partial [Meganyctiphanes norvegica]